MLGGLGCQANIGKMPQIKAEVGIYALFPGVATAGETWHTFIMPYIVNAL